MEKIKVKVLNKGNQSLPAYATEKSSGMDVRANIEEPILLMPGQRVLIPSGIHAQLPEGYEIQVRPRSGLALKHGIICAFGTVDGDFIGDIGVITFNISNEAYKIEPGERIGQLVLAKCVQCEWEEVNVLEATERGEGGYGHTGKQ